MSGGLSSRVKVKSRRWGKGARYESVMWASIGLVQVGGLIFVVWLSPSLTADMPYLGQSGVIGVFVGILVITVCAVVALFIAQRLSRAVLIGLAVVEWLAAGVMAALGIVWLTSAIIIMLLSAFALAFVAKKLVDAAQVGSKAGHSLSTSRDGFR